MPLIYLVRHGESPVNVTRTLSYRAVDPGLTERGQQQARALAGWFANRPVGAIYSSPLQRGLRTAESIAHVTGAPLHVSEALRELNVGSLDGRSDQPAWDTHDAVWARWRQGDRTASFPDGEDFRSVYARVTAFLEWVQRQHPADDVVAVGHGGIFCAVVPEVCTIPWEAGAPITLANTAVTILRPGQPLTCELWNGQAHLV